MAGVNLGWGQGRRLPQIPSTSSTLVMAAWCLSCFHGAYSSEWYHSSHFWRSGNSWITTKPFGKAPSRISPWAPRTRNLPPYLVRVDWCPRTYFANNSGSVISTRTTEKAGFCKIFVQKNANPVSLEKTCQRCLSKLRKHS